MTGLISGLRAPASPSVYSRLSSRHVTVSMGVAVWPEDGDSLTEALSITDLRLYQAKRTGRNRVVTATLEEERGRRRSDRRRSA